MSFIWEVPSVKEELLFPNEDRMSCTFVFSLAILLLRKGKGLLEEEAQDPVSFFMKCALVTGVVNHRVDRK